MKSNNNISNLQTTGILWLSCFFVFISSVFAQSTPPVYVPGPNDILFAINGASITLAAIAIGAGLIYVIAGYKLFRITLFLAGA